MATSALIEDVVAACESGVKVRGERRGFSKRRGVPDSVFWLRPDDDRLACHPLPVLIELEGTLAGAAADFEKFAARYEDTDYQYHLEWPVIGVASRDQFFHSVEYEIIGIRANQLSSDQSISERVMHKEAAAWFVRFGPTFETSATVRDHLSPPIVEWSVAFTMFGHRFEVQVPFFIGDGTDVGRDILRRVSTPTVPSVVVVNGKYDKRDKTTAYHETAVEFPSVHPIKFQN